MTAANGLFLCVLVQSCASWPERKGGRDGQLEKGSRRTFLEDLGAVDLDQAEVRVLVFLAVAHGGRGGGSVM